VVAVRTSGATDLAQKWNVLQSVNYLCLACSLEQDFIAGIRMEWNVKLNDQHSACALVVAAHEIPESISPPNMLLEQFKRWVSIIE